MPSFELGGGSMQPKYDAAGSPSSKFEPKYEPNLSMENSNSSIQAAEREARTEAPPRNILVTPENNSISMTLMQ